MTYAFTTSCFCLVFAIGFALASDNEYQFACDSVNMRTHFKQAINTAGETVQVHPLTSYITTSSCTNEGTTCRGLIARYSQQSRCAGSVRLVNALVQKDSTQFEPTTGDIYEILKGGNSKWHFEQIQVPGPCICWIYE